MESLTLDNEYVVEFSADNWSLKVCVQGVQANEGQDEGDVAIWLANVLMWHDLGFRPMDIATEIEYWKEPTLEERG